MTTEIPTKAPLALHLQTEQLMRVIQALRAGGFRVFACLREPGRYEVQDASSDCAAVRA
jgi:hypothetical protein